MPVFAGTITTNCGVNFMYRIIALTSIFLLLAMNVFAADEPLPMLYFSFDDDDEKEIIDRSGNGNDGKVFGSAKFVVGKYNDGVELGGPDTIDVLHSETLVFINELTVGIWVNLEGTANQKVIGKSPIGSGWVLGTNGGIYPEVWDKQGTNHTVTQGTVPANEWAHLAMTYNSETTDMILYINGEAVGTLNNGGQPIGDTTQTLVIGASPWGKDWPSAGIYDEVKLYNIAFDGDMVVNMLMEEGIGAKAVSALSKSATTWANIKHNR